MAICGQNQFWIRTYDSAQELNRTEGLFLNMVQNCGIVLISSFKGLSTSLYIVPETVILNIYSYIQVTTKFIFRLKHFVSNLNRKIFLDSNILALAITWQLR